MRARLIAAFIVVALATVPLAVTVAVTCPCATAAVLAVDEVVWVWVSPLSRAKQIWTESWGILPSRIQRPTEGMARKSPRSRQELLVTSDRSC